MAQVSSSARRRLGQLLVEASLLSEEQLKTALIEQRKWGGRLGHIVVEMGFVTETAMVTVLAAQLQLRTVDLDAATLPKRVIDHLRIDLAERYGVFPLGVEGNTLFLASSDPTNAEQQRELAFVTAKRVQIAVATASSIDRAIRRYYFGEDVAPGDEVHPPELEMAMFELDTARQAVVPAALQVVPPTPPPPSPPRAAPPPPPPPPPPTPPPAQTPVAPPQSTLSPSEAKLRNEIATLKAQLVAIEASSSSQARALRALLEILIESGLVSRDEYLEQLRNKKT